MKLTNEQVNALVSEALRQNQKIRNAEKEKLQPNLLKIKENAEKYHTILKQLPKGFINTLFDTSDFYWSITSITDTLKEKIKEEVEPKTPLLDSKQFRDEILIASIEAETMTDLKTKLKAKGIEYI